MNSRKQPQDEAQPEIPCEKLEAYLKDMEKHTKNLTRMQIERDLLGKRTAEERAEVNRKYA